MNLFLIIWLSVIIVLTGFCIYFMIDGRYFLCKKKRKKIELFLTNALKNFAAGNDIPITYHEKIGNSAGRLVYSYYTSSPQKLLEPKIQLLNQYKNEPYVLAHEIGHYLAITNSGDKTEEGADQRGRRFCESLLNKFDVWFMKDGFDIYFHKDS